MKSYKSVDEYIKCADKTHKDKLIQIRDIVKKTVPSAAESIAYGMPAYTWKEKPLFYFAAMKGHLGLYPTPGPIYEHKELLIHLSTSKGCVRVPYTQDVPVKIIRALLKSRVSEIKGI